MIQLAALYSHSLTVKSLYTLTCQWWQTLGSSPCRSRWSSQCRWEASCRPSPPRITIQSRSTRIKGKWSCSTFSFLINTHVDEPWEVLEDWGGLVKAGEVRHVLLLVILGLVHFLHEQHPLDGLVPLDLLHGGRHEALGLMRHPDKPLLRPLCLGWAGSEKAFLSSSGCRDLSCPRCPWWSVNGHFQSLADIKCLPKLEF